jgi:hypothetical protein
MKHDTGTATADSKNPVSEAVERASQPVFDRHPSATTGQMATDQALAGTGQALPGDPIAMAADREAASKAVAGLARLFSAIVTKRMEAAARNIGGQEFAAEFAEEIAVAEEEADSFGTLTAQIAEKHNLVRYLKFATEVAWGSLVVGVGNRWSSAMKRLAQMQKDKQALGASGKN